MEETKGSVNSDKEIKKYNDALKNGLLKIGRPPAGVNKLLKGCNTPLEIQEGLKKQYETLGLKLPPEPSYEAPKNSNQITTVSKKINHVTFNPEKHIYTFEPDIQIKNPRKVTKKSKTAYGLTPELMDGHEAVMANRQELKAAGWKLHTILQKEKEAVEQGRDIVDYLNQELKDPKPKDVCTGSQTPPLSVSYSKLPSFDEHELQQAIKASLESYATISGTTFDFNNKGDIIGGAGGGMGTTTAQETDLAGQNKEQSDCVEDFN